MKNKAFKVLGGILIALGVFSLIIQPFSPITGAVIDVSTTISKINFIASLSLIAIGFIILRFGREEDVSQRVIETPEFKRQTRGVNPKLLKNAIGKIGTGLAHEEYLKYQGDCTVRIDKGSRLHYQRAPDGRIILTRYEPSSKHG
ncbi:MAG: hypothetical protein AABX54_04665 [Nanoarchaeota archaeon]